jgi:hypothetical protein
MNKCIVKTCDPQNPLEYSSFLYTQPVPGEHRYDCYALCLPRTAYIDSDPLVSLPPTLKTLLDRREQNILSLDTVSAATYADSPNQDRVRAQQRYARAWLSTHPLPAVHPGTP